MSDPRRPRAATAALALAALAGCVLPLDPLTGIEIAWTFEEREASDGDAARRLRTCAGAGIDAVTVVVEDRADPARIRTFEHACDDGDQPPDALATAAARIFLDLRAGEYTVSLRATGDAGTVTVEREVTVDERGVGLESFDLAPPLRPFTLDLHLPAPCTALSLRLVYADPATALHPAGDATPDLYRANLQSDRGLTLAGDAHACGDPALPGLHTFRVEPNAYRLEVTVDDAPCALPLDLGDAHALVLDLEKLACDG